MKIVLMILSSLITGGLDIGLVGLVPHGAQAGMKWQDRYLSRIDECDVHLPSTTFTKLAYKSKYVDNLLYRVARTKSF